MSDLLERVKYPHLDRVERLQPGPQIALGNDIYWTAKEDGSNVGIALIGGFPEIRSRNMERADAGVYKQMAACPQWDGIIDLLTSAGDWNDEYVLFGELCGKGKSPTRIVTHEETHFVPFDIWSEKEQRFMNYTKFHQECVHAGLTPVELLGTCNAGSLDDLYKFEEMMLGICKDRNLEGTVAKAWVYNDWNQGEGAGTKAGTVYFKSKIDLPRPQKLPRMDTGDHIILPTLPDSEVFGAIEKSRVDIGDEAFRSIREAMPKIAEYVQAEAKHHLCSPPRNLVSYYHQRVRDLST